MSLWSSWWWMNSNLMEYLAHRYSGHYSNRVLAAGSAGTWPTGLPTGLNPRFHPNRILEIAGILEAGAGVLWRCTSPLSLWARMTVDNRSSNVLSFENVSLLVISRGLISHFRFSAQGTSVVFEYFRYPSGLEVFPSASSLH